MAIERGTVIDGKYEILKEIGRGGMSVVYLAMDNRLNKQWAVKVLQRQGIGKNNEVIINKVPDDTELMKRLDHPAIPRIVDIIDREDDPQIYIVMDYVEGESLDKILDEFGAQPQDLVIDWAKQICDTLGYLHSQKPPIIYRDMKPANIMLKPEGNIKLIDFGIAREYKEQSLADTTALGTRGYASPEHFGGRTDARSDIYTLGMTMHHLLTGADPRPKSYEYIPIREYNPELSSGLEHIIDKCTAWDPDDRYQNCNELMYDLEHYTEIDDNFKKKQKNRLLTFIISVSLAIVFAICSVTSYGMHNKYVNQNYDNLIVFNNENHSANLKAAVDIDSEDPRAYNEYLKFIVSDGKITESELSTLRTQYKGYIEKVMRKEVQIQGNKATTADYSKITFLAGVYTMIYYEADDSKNKAEAADDYFEILASGEDYNESELSKCFYAICKMYKESSFTPEGENEGFNITSYSDLFSQMDTLLSIIDSCDTGNSGNDAIYKTAFYKATMELLNSQMSQIHGNSITESEVTGLLDKLVVRLEDYKDSSNKDAKNNATSALALEDDIKNRIGEYYDNPIRND